MRDRASSEPCASHLIVVALAALLALAGCTADNDTAGRGAEAPRGDASPESPNGPSVVDEGPASAPESYLDNLTPLAAGAAARLQAAGELRVVMLRNPQEYAPDEPEKKRGFDYRLALAFADSLGIGLTITADRSLASLFAHDGVLPAAVQTDESIMYDPDGFRDFDVFAIALAVNEWRRRIAIMVPIYPVGISIIGPNASSITTIADLDGQRVTTVAGEFQETFLKNLMKSQDISVRFVHRPQGSDAYAIMRSGNADITLDGSIFVASGMHELADMEVSPLALDRVTVGWAVSKNEPGIAELVTAFVEQSLEDGTVASIWFDTHGVDFETYLRLVGLR